MRACTFFDLSGLRVLLLAILLSSMSAARAQNINGTPIRMDVGPTGALPANNWIGINHCTFHSAAAATGGRTMSSDGEFVLIQTTCPYDPADTNPHVDLYLFSRTLGTTELITRAWHGGPTAGDVSNATISGDGRYIAYESFAPDILSPGIPHGLLYFLDRATGQTVPIDVTSTGAAPIAPPGFQQGGGSPHISADGSYVVYIASAPNLFPQHNPPIQRGFLRWSRVTGQAELVNYAGDGSVVPNPSPSGLCVHAISADGGRVLFCGQGFEYVPLPLGAPGARHVLMRDMIAGTTTLINTDQDGVLSTSPSPYTRHILSDDGLKVFLAGGQWPSVPESLNHPLWAYEKDLVTGSIRPIGLGAPNTAGIPAPPFAHSSGRDIVLIIPQIFGIVPGTFQSEPVAVFARTGRAFRPAEWGDGNPMVLTPPLIPLTPSSGAQVIAISDDGRWAMITAGLAEFGTYLVSLPIADPVTVGYSSTYPAPFLNVRYPEGGLSVAYARWCPPSQPGYLALTLNATASVVSLAGGGVSAVIPYGSAMNVQSDAQGLVKLPFPWPSVLTGHVVHAQMGMVDPSAPAGYVLTDTVRLQLP